MRLPERCGCLFLILGKIKVLHKQFHLWKMASPPTHTATLLGQGDQRAPFQVHVAHRPAAVRNASLRGVREACLDGAMEWTLLTHSGSSRATVSWIERPDTDADGELHGRQP